MNTTVPETLSVLPASETCRMPTGLVSDEVTHLLLNDVVRCFEFFLSCGKRQRSLSVCPHNTCVPKCLQEVVGRFRVQLRILAVLFDWSEVEGGAFICCA